MKLAPLIVAFHKGMRYELAHSAGHSASCFGGPLECELAGVRVSPRSLHYLGRLSDQQLRFLGAPAYVFEVPLIYGFRLSGCRLTYKLVSRSEVKIVSLSPRKPSLAFPYKGYPNMLPYVPLAVTTSSRMSYKRFAESVPNLPEQQAADLVIAVPPPAAIGVSLWGRYGDPEGVTVIFECDLASRTVSAFNVCT